MCVYESFRSGQELIQSAPGVNQQRDNNLEEQKVDRDQPADLATLGGLNQRDRKDDAEGKRPGRDRTHDGEHRHLELPHRRWIQSVAPLQGLGHAIQLLEEHRVMHAERESDGERRDGQGLEEPRLPVGDEADAEQTRAEHEDGREQVDVLHGIDFIPAEQVLNQVQEGDDELRVSELLQADQGADHGLSRWEGTGEGSRIVRLCQSLNNNTPHGLCGVRFGEGIRYPSS